MRITSAEDALKGKKVTDDVISAAAEFAYKGAKPVDNMVKIQPSYRKDMAKEIVIDAIKEALSRTH